MAISIPNLHELIVTIFVSQYGMSKSNEYRIVFDIYNLAFFQHSLFISVYMYASVYLPLHQAARYSDRWMVSEIVIDV